MKNSTIAVVAPGDMGHAIGQRLGDGGLRVITDLTGRSKRSHDLAAAAGIEAVSGPSALLSQAAVILSVMPPSAAIGFATDLAAAAQNLAGPPPLVVDLNAIAPATAQQIGDILSAADLAFIDGGIVGGPPKGSDAGPRIYVSGSELARLDMLRDAGLDMRPIAGGIGAASGLKMCYASMTKGITALQIEALVAARALGCDAELHAEMAFSQAALVDRADAWLPASCPKAYRWIGEMEEIAATFKSVGLTPLSFQGVAEIYRMVERSPLGKETVETRSLASDAATVAKILAAALPPPR